MLQRHSTILLFLLLVGCLPFGPNVSTTTPSADEIRRCRAEMYIEPAIEIQPEGFKLTTGIDDAIWFKFTAKTDKITDVFVQDIVDTTKFVPNFKLDGTSMPSWWDVSTKPLTGGNVELPNVRFMNVGYRTNANGTVTVYIMWHEV